MVKELPYFKFFVSEWLLGRISDETYRIQGIFLNACCYYWNKENKMTFDDLSRKIGKKNVESLKNMRFLEIENNNVRIQFLDEQRAELIDLQVKRSIAGQAGGQASVKQRLSKTKAKVKHLDKDKEEDIYKKEYFKDIDINSAFVDYLKVRKKLKCVNTERVINRLIKKIREHSNNKKDVAIEIIEKAINSGWKDFYKLNDAR